jgi:hypothetical protein
MSRTWLIALSTTLLCSSDVSSVYCNMQPLTAIALHCIHTGSFVLQRGFDLFVPQFVGYLARDYKRWSTGDDVRAPVVTAAESNGSSNGSSSNVNDDTAAFS